MENTSMKPKITPKDFFIWLGAMVALYWSVIAFVFLMFDYIDYAFPNVLEYQPDPYSGSIPYQMASIIVLFPLYATLIFLIRRDIARDTSRQDLWIRRWALIFTLFIASLTMVGDVVMLLTAYFGGEELAVSFLMKIALVFLVAALIFMHFIADLKGYWNTNRMKAGVVSIAVGFLAFASVFSGFLIIGTPQQARLARLDIQKVTDLQIIQGQIVYFWQQKDELPQSLSDLQNSINGFIVPRDPQSGEAYVYRVTKAPYTFELCAVFNKENQNPDGYGNTQMTRPIPAFESNSKGDILTSTWAHGEGETCFERPIDPAFYPPINR